MPKAPRGLRIRTPLEVDSSCIVSATTRAVSPSRQDKLASTRTVSPVTTRIERASTVVGVSRHSAQPGLPVAGPRLWGPARPRGPHSPLSRWRVGCRNSVMLRLHSRDRVFGTYTPNPSSGPTPARCLRHEPTNLPDEPLGPDGGPPPTRSGLRTPQASDPAKSRRYFVV